MADNVELTTIEDVDKAVAPWWHTAVMALLVGAVSVQSAMNHGLPGFPIPGLDTHLSRYFFVIVAEWVMILFIWLGLKSRGLSMRSLIGGRWATASKFFIDFGIGCAFMLVGIVTIGAISHLLGGDTGKTVASLMPKSIPQVLVWVVLSATGGICEEIIFRGYLMRQLRAWSGNWAIAIIGQGIAFGLAHGYYLRAMVAIFTYGCMLGTLAWWRKSIRPGMIAHFMQDALGGILGYLTVK